MQPAGPGIPFLRVVRLLYPSDEHIVSHVSMKGRTATVSYLPFLMAVLR